MAKFVGGYSVTGSDICVVNATVTLSTGGAQGANDFVGFNGTPLTVSNCADVNGGGGLVLGAEFVDGDLQSIAGELWIFDSAPAGLGNDNAAFTISDADAAHVVCVIPFSTYYASNNNSVSFGVPPQCAPFVCAAASKDLYGAFATRGAPTYTTAVPLFRLFILKD
jgi:hypothetical protein